MDFVVVGFMDNVLMIVVRQFFDNYLEIAYHVNRKVIVYRVRRKNRTSKQTLIIETSDFCLDDILCKNEFIIQPWLFNLLHNLIMNFSIEALLKSSVKFRLCNMSHYLIMDFTILDATNICYHAMGEYDFKTTTWEEHNEFHALINNGYLCKDIMLIIMEFAEGADITNYCTYCGGYDCNNRFCLKLMYKKQMGRLGYK
jgi:hypothetical protein